MTIMRMQRANFDADNECDKARMTDRHHWRNNGLGPADLRDSRDRGTPSGVGETRSTAGQRIKRKKEGSKPKGFPPARKRLPKRDAQAKRLAMLAERHPEVYARVSRGL